MPITTELKVCGDSAQPVHVTLGPTGAALDLTGSPVVNLPDVSGTLKLSPVAISLPTIDILIAPQFLNLLVLLLSGAPGLLEQILKNAGGVWDDIADGAKDLADNVVGALNDAYKNAVSFSAPAPAGGGSLGRTDAGGSSAAVDTPSIRQQLPGDLGRQSTTDAVVRAAAVLLPLMTIKLGTIKVTALEDKGAEGLTVNLNLKGMPIRVDLDAVHVATQVQPVDVAVGAVKVTSTASGSLI